MSMLIVFGGLPGCGESTLARQVAERLGAVLVRVDTIEHQLRTGPSGEDVGEAGYRIAYAVAADNLRLGHIVAADPVNPLPVTREAWRRVATETGATIIAVEVVCSDTDEHRRRVETRHIDIAGFVGPSWAESWRATIDLGRRRTSSSTRPADRWRPAT
jgi:predicted kinase